MIIITASGKARHGKNSFCDILKEKFNELNKKSIIVNYADYLKYLAKQYFNWNGEKDEVGRTLLQQLGTEKIRSKNPSFWVDTVINLEKVLSDDFDFMLIGDARFPNEILQWEYDGYDVIPVHITRINFHNELTKEQQQHKSETALDDFSFDYCIEAEDLKGLEAEVDKFVDKLKEDGYI